MLQELTGTCDPSNPYVNSLINGPIGSTVGPENAALPLCGVTDLSTSLKNAWRPEIDGPLYVDGCRLTWHTRATACDLLENLGMLFVTGDSLTRQVAQALLMILTGDYRTGAVLHMSSVNRSECQCE